MRCPSAPHPTPPSTQQKEKENDFIDLCSDDEDDIPIVIDGEDISCSEELIAQQRELLACYATGILL